MQVTLIELGVAAGAAIASSAVLGWWWRGRSQSTQRAILDELWTRKLRSMEVALEESETFRTREGTGQRMLQAELESTRESLASAKQAYRDASDEITELKASLERRRLDVEALDQAGAEMASRRKRVLAELEQERERSAKLAAKVKRLAPLPARIAEREEELARLDRKHAAALDSRDADLRRMTDWVAELSSLPDALKTREADVRELRARLRAEVAKSEERSAEAQEQLAVLDAEKLSLSAQHAELQSALAKRDAELELLRAEHDALERRAKEHSARIDQLESAAAAVDARIERERQSFEDIAAAQRDESSTAREGLMRKLNEREDELRNAQRALAAARAESEGARVELRSLQRRVEELNRADARRGDQAGPVSARSTAKTKQTTSAALFSETPPESAVESVESAPAIAPTKTRRKPKDELSEAVGATAPAPRLFAESEPAAKAIEAADSSAVDAEVISDVALAKSAPTPDSATIETSQADDEIVADPEIEGATVVAETPVAPVSEAILPFVEAVQAAVEAQQAELEAEHDEAESVNEAADEPAAPEEVAAAREELEVEDDEPEKIIKPHRAAPPSMPAFPGIESKSKTTARGKAPRKSNEKAATTTDAPSKTSSTKTNAQPEAPPKPSQSGAGSTKTNGAVFADDFTRIRGIGPRTANKLVATGIKTFADFADLAGEQLDQVAHAVGVSAAKIKSSGWQRSARRLAKSKR